MTTKVVDFDIRRAAYELYKLYWIEDHTTTKIRHDTLRNYYLYCKECADDGTKIYSFDEWLNDVGYSNGSMYVCFEEFCDEEYQDENLVRYLLGDEELIALYLKDKENSK